jgi:hypothetical protein
MCWRGRGVPRIYCRKCLARIEIIMSKYDAVEYVAWDIDVEQLADSEIKRRLNDE